MQYKIIKHDDADLTERVTQEYLSYGWELRGDLIVVLSVTRLYYIQVVVKQG